jgi:hypothetical protein
MKRLLLTAAVGALGLAMPQAHAAIYTIEHKDGSDRISQLTDNRCVASAYSVDALLKAMSDWTTKSGLPPAHIDTTHTLPAGVTVIAYTAPDTMQNTDIVLFDTQDACEAALARLRARLPVFPQR